MALKKTFLSVELEDGTVHEDVRITFQDQLAWSKSAKARGLDLEDGESTAFLIWKALERQRLTSDKYTEFLPKIVDIAIGDDEPAEAGPTE